MKLVYALFSVLLFSLAVTPIWARDFTECRVQADTQLLLYPLTPGDKAFVAAGALVVASSGDKIGRKEILADQPIYFQQQGKISTFYAWLYAPLGRVENLEDTYVASPPGNEHVVISFRPQVGHPEMTIVHYGGDIRGSYLTLICD